MGLTQHLTEMSTRNISWGKRGRCIGLTSYHLHGPTVLKSGNLKLLEPSGPVQGSIETALSFFNLLLAKQWNDMSQQDNHVTDLHCM